MAIDYKKFLNKSEELVLPFLGTPRLSGENRTFRLKQAPEQPGWFRFKIQGRLAEPLGPADPPDLAKLPKVRGHMVGPRLVQPGALAEEVLLMPEEQPPPFSPLLAQH